MSKAKQEIDALAELHGDDAAQVRALLVEADAMNAKARQYRVEAGRLLAGLRCGGGDWRRGTGTSAETAQRLIQLYTGEG